MEEPPTSLKPEKGTSMGIQDRLNITLLCNGHGFCRASYRIWLIRVPGRRFPRPDALVAMLVLLSVRIGSAGVVFLPSGPSSPIRLRVEDL